MVRKGLRGSDGDPHRVHLVLEAQQAVGDALLVARQPHPNPLNVAVWSETGGDSEGPLWEGGQPWEGWGRGEGAGWERGRGAWGEGFIRRAHALQAWDPDKFRNDRALSASFLSNQHKIRRCCFCPHFED